MKYLRTTKYLRVIALVISVQILLALGACGGRGGSDGGATTTPRLALLAGDMHGAGNTDGAAARRASTARTASLPTLRATSMWPIPLTTPSARSRPPGR